MRLAPQEQWKSLDFGGIFWYTSPNKKTKPVGYPPFSPAYFILSSVCTQQTDHHVPL